MADPMDTDRDEAPLDPTLERVQARLKRMMMIAMGTLGIGVLAVFVAILFRVSKMGGPSVPTGEAWKSVIEIATKGDIVATNVSGDQVAVTVVGPEGRVIEVYNLPTGKLIGKSVLIGK
ncbi:hypothetical protein [Oryzibacter oryziterrae]|uniref:hypothetical protein n=1 Tax=Oryzibacter oryziterrae TaxID=2766474 RepID=UPI001F41965E|nr:hypothetical protein [Oryzibacter oryziterrae]